MSRMYSVDLYLDIELNKESFKKLATRGLELGIVYLKRDDYVCMVETIREYLSVDEFADKIIEDLKDHAGDIDYVHGIACKYEDTYFILGGYYKWGEPFNFSCFILCEYWYKNFGDERYLDFVRYVKLMTDLCQDFPIMKICTETLY